MNVDNVIQDIIRREGGFVDHHDDPGGATRYGITQKTLSEWRGKLVSKDDVRNLDQDEARDIYRRRYVLDPGYHQIGDDHLAALLVDSGVQHGPRRATMWLQEAVGAVPDGVIGPQTLSALRRHRPRDVYLEVLARRAEFYGEIISENRSYASFALGWARRIGEFIRDA